MLMELDVKPITAEDEKLFSKYFEKSGLALDYGNSWAYVGQATFFGGYKWHDGKNLVVVTTRAPGGLPFVIAKAAGRNYLDAAADLAEKLCTVSGAPVIMKNLDDIESSYLFAKGFSDYRGDDSWSQHYRYDDDTFPETIIVLDELAELKGGELKTLRYQLNRFKKNMTHEMRPLSENSFADALYVVTKWGGSLLEKYAHEFKTDPLGAHSIDLHKKYIEQAFFAGRKALRRVHYANEKPAGFSLVQPVSRNCVGVYSNITTNVCSGLSETVMFSALMEAKEKGYLFANLGGSEYRSLYLFKQKFAPSALIQKRHAVLYPKKA